MAPDRAEAATLLEQFGLGAFLHAYPHEVSAGMRQRASLARTFFAPAPSTSSTSPSGPWTP